MNALPVLIGTPSTALSRSLIKNGTPANGPSPIPRAICARACASILVVIALMLGLICATRSSAVSSNSSALTSPLRTSCARPNTSYWSYSARILLMRGSSRRVRETPQVGVSIPYESIQALRGSAALDFGLEHAGPV